MCYCIRMAQMTRPVMLCIISTGQYLAFVRVRIHSTRLDALTNFDIASSKMHVDTGCDN